MRRCNTPANPLDVVSDNFNSTDAYFPIPRITAFAFKASFTDFLRSCSQKMEPFVFSAYVARISSASRSVASEIGNRMRWYY